MKFTDGCDGINIGEHSVSKHTVHLIRLMKREEDSKNTLETEHMKL